MADNRPSLEEIFGSTPAPSTTTPQARPTLADIFGSTPMETLQNAQKSRDPFGRGAAPVPEIVQKAQSDAQLTRQGIDPNTGKKKKGILRKVADFFTSAEQAFGQTLGDALSAGKISKQLAASAQAEQELAQQLRNKLKTKDSVTRQRGLQRLQTIENSGGGAPDFGEIVPSSKKSAKQIFGEAAGVTADIASFGTFGKAAQGAKSLHLAKGLKPLAPAVGKTAAQSFAKGFARHAPRGVAFGTAFGVANSMQQDKDLKGIVKDAGIGALTGGIVSGVVGGIVTRNKFLAPQKAQALREKARAQYMRGLRATKQKYKDDAARIVDDLLDEGYWGTQKSLLNKAKKGVKLNEKQYNKLGELEGMISVEGVLTEIDDRLAAMKNPKGGVFSADKTLFKSLTEIHDDLTSMVVYNNEVKRPAQKMLNTIRERIIESTTVKNSKQYSDPSFQKMFWKDNGMWTKDLASDRLDDLVAKLDDQMPGVNWKRRILSHVDLDNVNDEKMYQGAMDSVDEFLASSKGRKLVGDSFVHQKELLKLKQKLDRVYQGPVSNLKDADKKKVIKEAADSIRDVLNSNNPEWAQVNKMYHMNRSLEGILKETLNRTSSHNKTGLAETITGGFGALGGLVSGGVSMAIVGGTALLAGIKTLRSTWYNTLSAVSKNKVADYLVNKSGEDLSHAMIILSNQGVKAVQKIISGEMDEEIEKQKAEMGSSEDPRPSLEEIFSGI